jgi:TrmH family RNA methyltransferase
MKTEISKAKISLINSLSINKYRKQHNLFVAEGEKIVLELIHSEFNVKYLIYNKDFNLPILPKQSEIYCADEITMKKLSNLKTQPTVIAVVEIPQYAIEISELKNKLTICLDDIQDPGNLGTIIRICDWFGIENIFCSENSVDVYNPKVVQASMGAFLRVKVFYKKLTDFIPEYKRITKNQCYGTFLKGKDIYKEALTKSAMIVLGNEGKGINEDLEKQLDARLFIPSFSNNVQHAESLNISMATAIICSEFRRR